MSKLFYYYYFSPFFGACKLLEMPLRTFSSIQLLGAWKVSRFQACLHLFTSLELCILYNEPEQQFWSQVHFLSTGSTNVIMFRNFWNFILLFLNFSVQSCLSKWPLWCRWIINQPYEYSMPLPPRFDTDQLFSKSLLLDMNSVSSF